MRNRQPYLTILILSLLPTVAYANAGTPLLLASIFHLMFGNFLIGCLEATLITLLFRASKWKESWKTFLTLIVANYVSAWFGAACISGIFHNNGTYSPAFLTNPIDITIEYIRFWFWVMMFIAFILTMLIEYPFFLFALRKSKRYISKSIVAILLIHGISYGFLIGWYWNFSNASIMTELEYVSVEEMNLPSGYNLYFISESGKGIIKSDIEGKNVENIKSINAAHEDDRLFVRPKETSSYDLYLLYASDEPQEYRDELILEDFSSLAPVEKIIREHPTSIPIRRWRDSEEVPILTEKSDWLFKMSLWDGTGIICKNETKQKYHHFTMATPLILFTARNAMHIEGDFVVFQFTNNQICVLQPDKKQIALIARGKGPVVAKRK